MAPAEKNSTDISAASATFCISAANLHPSFQGWLLVDYICDAIYLLDLLVRMHEGYLDQGIMVKEAAMLRKNYRKSKFFKVDIVSILPTDFAYFFFEGKCSEQVPCPVIFRLNRVARIDRMFEFFNKTESRTNFPNAFRITKVVIQIVILIHWNACVFFAISFAIGFNTDTWVYQVKHASQTLKKSTKTSTSGEASNNPPIIGYSTSGKPSLGDAIHLQLLLVDPDIDNHWRNTAACKQHRVSMVLNIFKNRYEGHTMRGFFKKADPPESNQHLVRRYAFVTIDFLVGVLIFASIVGNIGAMIANMNAARNEFQNRMDAIKQYMVRISISNLISILFLTFTKGQLWTRSKA